MKAFVVLLALSAMVLLSSCGSDAPPSSSTDPGSSFESSNQDASDGSSSSSQGTIGAGGEESRAPLDISTQDASRQVISIADVSLEVSNIEAALIQVRPIAEGLGGFVDQVTSFGLVRSREAVIVVRVPQSRFFDALERLEALGAVIQRSVESEEVSAEIIDLNARLRSVQRQEESFLALLERAESIADVLTVERELSRVRTQIEQLQGQLLALERSVALSTITARFSLPAQPYPEPSTAILTVAVSNVPASVAFVQLLAAERNGIVSNTLFTFDEGQHEADLQLLLFEGNFSDGVAAIEDRGDVLKKTLREKASEPNSLVRPTPANSITIRFVEKGDGWVAVTLDLIKVLGYLLGFVIAIGASIAIVRVLAGTKVGKAAIRAVMGGEPTTK